MWVAWPDPAPTPIDGSICATPSIPLSSLSSWNATSLVPSSEVPSGRVDVDRPLAHVLVRHELAPDHAVQRERHQDAVTTEMPMMTPEWSSAQFTCRV